MNTPPPVDDSGASVPSGQPEHGHQPGHGHQPPPTGYVWAPVQLARPTNTLALLSLIIAFLFAPAAIVLGHVARRQIRDTGEQGDGLAVAGMVCGYAFTGLTVVTCLFVVVLQLVMMAVGIGVIGWSDYPAPPAPDSTPPPS